jgi:hypothetical protein
LTARFPCQEHKERFVPQTLSLYQSARIIRGERVVFSRSEEKAVADSDEKRLAQYLNAEIQEVGFLACIRMQSKRSGASRLYLNAEREEVEFNLILTCDEHDGIPSKSEFRFAGPPD